MFSLLRKTPFLVRLLTIDSCFYRARSIVFQVKNVGTYNRLDVFGYKTIITQERATVRTKAGSYSKWGLGRGILGRRMKFKDF